MKTLDLTAFTTAVKDEQLAVRGMRVYQNGALVASYQPEPEQRQNQYSGTKSFTSTACAFAIQEGLFSLDDVVLDHFAADAPAEPSENLKKMKLRHLITMSMGFENPMLMGAMRPKMVEKDWVKFVLNAKVVHEPGTVFQYNNAGPYLLGILVQRKTGMSLVDYPMPRLFDRASGVREGSAGKHLWCGRPAAERLGVCKAGSALSAKGAVERPTAHPGTVGRGSRKCADPLRSGR